MKSTFDKRLKQALKDNNFKQIDVIEKSKKYYEEVGTKISKTDLSQYVNGKTKPSQKKLYTLAKVLNVSEAWLLGYNVPKERMSDEERKEDTIAAHLDGDYTEDELKQIREFAELVRKARKG